MSGQIAQTAAQGLANHIAGNVPPFIGTSAPTWIPGLVWINTTSGAVLFTWNGSAWVSGAAGHYLALLTASPFTSGPGGGYAVAISDLVELSIGGYTRQAVAFSNATASYPSNVSNSATVTFGPLSASMTQAAQWVAMVSAASGTSGLLNYYWTLATPQQVSVSQSIQIAAGALVLSQS